MTGTADGDVAATGVVPVDGRGDLVHLLLHGRPLTVHAAQAMERAGVLVVPEGADPWPGARVAARPAGRPAGWTAGLPFVLHDPLCPLTPAAFIARLVGDCADSGRIQVGVRPVTDTIKTTRGGVVGTTLERSALWSVTSPVVLPAVVVAALADQPGARSFGPLVQSLRVRFGLDLVEAPAGGRRVEDAAAVRLLEALPAAGD